ncbi:hypothetical protein [Kutzneria albida]|uniref:Uncharacterized protein n=1 Tax=Kutzneria albida DSM 43870 TaxID=1449976 RepID=W5WMX5_9PSEU|nr:hypothetical protein [Kutzneria albida]AHH99529.1 hypothetical protein KALB_6169 [Kutzneria albida DSM 43870]
MGEYSGTHIVIIAVVLALIVAALWPTEAGGGRLLRGWGLPDADREQRLIARNYLRNRRVLYLVFSLAPLPLFGSSGWLVVMLAGLLLAELVAAFTPVRGGTRVATLRRRTWRDLVPRWVMATYLTFAGLAVLGSVLVLLATPWAAESAANQPFSQLDDSTPVLSLVIVGVATLAAGGLVLLATARPSVGDAAADSALRVRSARVMIALATVVLADQASRQLRMVGDYNSPQLAGHPGKPEWLALAGAVFGGATSWFLLLAAALAWILIANPMRRPGIVVAATR